MAASLKEKRTPITTPPYQVPCVDIAPASPIFSLVTTFNTKTYPIPSLLGGQFVEKPFCLLASSLLFDEKSAKV